MSTNVINEKVKNNIKNNIYAWLFLTPFLFFYSCFLLFPILRSFYLSFFKSSLGKSDVFIGFQNYITMVADKDFWGALFNTMFFVVISTPVIVATGFILALLVDSKLKGTTFIRSAFFVSYILSMSVVTSLWTFIFQPYTGLISTFVASFGGPEIFWLNTKWLVWLAILITTNWWTVGFNMVLFLSGLQGIPAEIYESAMIDGSNTFQTIFKITIPMLRPVTALTCLLQIIASFKLFGQTYLMAQGGPGTHTRTLVHYIYETGFVNQKMGYAAAMSLALFAVIISISLIQSKILQRSEDN